MTVKISFLAGVGVGYLLGSRAGRPRYDQIIKMARDFAGRPEVDTVVTTATTAADSLVDRAKKTVNDTVDLVASGTDGAEPQQPLADLSRGGFDRKQGTGPVVAGGVGPLTSPPA